ncbi:phage terminase large subunit family protein [Cupriavidus oxalaticus]|uniref:Phage terminase large subunit family protein n=1 Tax=Cupriavidus oxalaticus TaxID=96344 RepID=A0A375GFD2_9BURK|nr:terminase gpA endonuclease subunit [Cupriavidus oxalaticus]QRQ86260.1 phage terminase large subunit family protein [Cupriavidus oxalaticus]QRQ95413.1 phage terminase large subunit family protein [Cupriavidus oxalaticus]WQD84070.1 terminase gpA endonuclease subunit [Cupriavidus oxalaticus]SPC17384.1 Terminase GpA [Cupriavidus oxalaticus]
MFDETAHYAIALGDVLSPFEAFRPPKRMSVSEGAAQNLIIKQTGGPATPWSPDETPYMVEPTDMLASRRHEALAFIGPARTGKTAALLLGWMAHAAVNDPGDMLIVQMSQDKAREFSKTDIDRALRHSPNLAAMKSAASQDDTVHDKQFRHGMWLRIAWPTVSNLSGSTYRYVAFTDLDRMPDDIGGEGAPFPLGLKRTTTFMSRGMALAESSPGRDLEDPNWRPATPHEAPPTSGILGIYNGSDRRRWYWKCPDCREWFEAAPGLGLFNLPSDDELGQIVREGDINALADQYNRIICPHCGAVHLPKAKPALNRCGRWLAEGQHITADDELIGEAVTSPTVGYWLGGVAAAFQSWKSLLLRYFQALRQYELSGDEEPLKNTTNVDQGMPYMSRHLAEAGRTSVGPADRAEQGLARYIVPEQTRFLTAQVDVQGGTNARFVVQVHAHGPHNEQWLVDRYNLTESAREGMGGMAPIDPASYAEDWDVLTERVVRATYRTPMDGLELRVKMVAVDSGGEDGVTDKAYAWYRRLRREGLHGRVMLVKGASSKTAPRIKESWVGNRNGREKGDIPLYVFNPNLLKDEVAAGLRRPSPGPGYYHFPKPKSPQNPGGWLPMAFFDELTAEVRDPRGVWRQVRKRNEAFDLCVYAIAARLRLGADKIKNWGRAPTWAKPLAENSELIAVEGRREMKASVAVERPPAEAAPAAPAVRRRRVARSSYLG